MSTMAASSLTTLRDASMRFAPLAASCSAAALPKPSEAPVRRMVCVLSVLLTRDVGEPTLPLTSN